MGNRGHKIKNNSQAQHKKHKNKAIKKGVFFKTTEMDELLLLAIFTFKPDSIFC